MESGKCGICGKMADLTACVLCDKLVCPDCYVIRKNICTACRDAGDTDLGSRSMGGKY